MIHSICTASLYYISDLEGGLDSTGLKSIEDSFGRLGSTWKNNTDIQYKL